MDKIPALNAKRPVNLYLRRSTIRDGSRVAYQFHGQKSLSELADKLLRREISRRLSAARKAA